MKSKEKINQSQFYSLITGEELSWQAIIYDLIKTEQLDPWDINIVFLSEKFLETINELEDGNFFVSSKVLFACSLLLRLKSEILANSYIQELNDILFGKKEIQQTLDIEKIIINESELPILTPKSPIARAKKITLDQLMSALNKAINTENRRIKRTIKTHQAKKIAELILPKSHFIPLKIRIKKIVDIITTYLSNNQQIEFTQLAKEKQEKQASFLPILHLSNEQKIYLYQKKHFDEIYITKEIHPEDLEKMNSELEKETNP